MLPADQTIERDEVFRDVLRTAADELATGIFDIEDPLVTLGVRVDRPATEYGYLLPDVGRGEERGGLRAYPLRAFEEKPTPARAEQLGRAGRRRLERGHLPVAPPGDPRRPPALHRAAPVARPDGRHRRRCSSAPTNRSSKALSIDYAVMESAARDGRVVMAPMDVGWSDLGSWSALLAALGARGDGAVVQPGETVEVGDDDLVDPPGRRPPRGHRAARAR